MVHLKDNGFQVRGEDVADLFSELDGNHDGVLDWQEFCVSMCNYRKLEYDLLKMSAGFSSIESGYLQHIFESADEDKGGELSMEEMLELLEICFKENQVDKKAEIKKISQLFSRMDKDKSKSLDQLEFIRLIRVWNTGRGEKQEILKVFKEASQVDESLNEKALRKKMGVSGADEPKASVQLRAFTVQQDVQDGLLADEHHMTLEEVRTLRESFEFCDSDGNGLIDREELPFILKILGCVPLTGQQQRAHMRTLEREEFREDFNFEALLSFLVMYLKACVEEALQGIKTDNPDKEQEGVPMQRLMQALYQVGQYLKKDDAQALLETVGGNQESEVVDQITFLKMLEADRSSRLFEWRKTCGFSKSQLLAIEQAFSKHSGGDGGSITNHESAVLSILQVLNLAPSPQEHDTLMHGLLRVDREGKGTITFHDFLLLVRLLENQRLHARTLEEKQRARAAGLDADAVRQFRKVFDDCKRDDCTKADIDLTRALLADLQVVRTHKEKMHLKEAIEAVADSDGLEFSHFLEVLVRVEGQQKRC